MKFKDADLVGIPFRITVGKKVTEGTVEVVLRSTREVRDVTITAIVEYFQGVARPGGMKGIPMSGRADCRTWEQSKHIVGFLAIVAAVYAGFQIIPPELTNYSFQDDLKNIAMVGGSNPHETDQAAAWTR